MEIFSGKMNGPVNVAGEWQLLGMVVGDLHVVDGGHVILNGMVTGNLIIEKGASVELHGMINGKTIVRGGSVEIWGHTQGVVIEDETSKVVIDPDAFVGG